MRRPFFICVLLICSVMPHTTIAEISGVLSKEAIALSQSTTLNLTSTDGNIEMPELPEVPGLTYAGTSQSSHTTIVNGRMSQKNVLGINITAERTGEFTIPEFEVKTGGKTYRIGPFKLKVTQYPAGINPQEIASLQMPLPRKEFYIGESFPLELVVDSRHDQQMQVIRPLTPPQFDAPFAHWEFPDEPEIKQRSGKVNLLWTVAMTPLRTGNYDLSSSLRLNLGRNTGRYQGGFFGFQNTENFALTLNADSQAIQVKPLPEVPEGSAFTGAIGQFNFTASALPASIEAGTPITFNVTIQGAGNFTRLSQLPLDTTDDWRVYTPEVAFKPTDALKINGAKTFRYLIEPRRSGAVQFPDLNWCWFNPQTGTYNTFTIPGRSIQVTGTIVQNEKETGQDVADTSETLTEPTESKPVLQPLVQKTPTERPLALIFWPKGTLWLIGLLIATSYLLRPIVRLLKQTTFIAPQTRLKRRLRKTLAQINQQAKQGVLPDIEQLMQLIRQIAGWKLQLHAEAMTAQELKAHGDAELSEILQTLEQSRYSGWQYNADNVNQIIERLTLVLEAH